MANHKSALKRIRQSEIRAARNSAVKTRIKKIERKFRESLKTESIDSEAKLREAIALWSKAASKGVITASKASRKVSRLTKHFNASKA